MPMDRSAVLAVGVESLIMSLHLFPAHSMWLPAAAMSVKHNPHSVPEE